MCDYISNQVKIQILGMGDTCKFHSIRFQVLLTKYRNGFDTILSTFAYHGYLLQIYQRLSECELWVYIIA